MLLTTLIAGSLIVHAAQRAPTVADRLDSLQEDSTEDSDTRRRVDTCWFKARHRLGCWLWELGSKCSSNSQSVPALEWVQAAYGVGCKNVYTCSLTSEQHARGSSPRAAWMAQLICDGRPVPHGRRRLDDDDAPKGAIGNQPSDDWKAQRHEAELSYFENLGRPATEDEMKHLVEEREHGEDTSVEECLSECFGSSNTINECHDLCV